MNNEEEKGLKIEAHSPKTLAVHVQAGKGLTKRLQNLNYIKQTEEEPYIMSSFIQQISIMAIPLFLGVILHEVAHGWVASKLGDPTARLSGRLTMNPLAHIDLFGSIVIPALLIFTRAPFLFGYAKPVPVNFNNLRNPKKDMVWVALAGAVTNLLLALGFSIVHRFLMTASPLWELPFMRLGLQPLILMLRYGVAINVALAVFNLIPIPPLDGGRVMVGLLPMRAAYQYSKLEPFGFLIVIGLLVTHILDWLISPLIYFFIELFLGAFIYI